MIASGWDNFYVILGSAAAALIGVQFVVIALIAGLRTQITAESIGAFGTPTVVHLTGALVVSALMTAPIASPSRRAATIALLGGAGLVYSALVVGRAKRQTTYAPVFEDWLWHALLPFASYVLLVVSAIARAPFCVAAATLGLLLVGIHNAWDTVTHMLVTTRERP